MTLVNVPDIEEILVTDIRDFIDNDVAFQTIYPNFGYPNVTQEHPFAVLTERMTSGAQVNPAEIFPCIAVMDLQETWNPQQQVPAELDNMRMTSAELADINTNRSQYIITDAEIAALQTAVTAQGVVGGRGVSTTWRSNITVEVWADQAKVKNVLYYLMQAYFLGPRRYDLRTTYGITPVLPEMTADKTGVYNFDFGVELWGAMIRIPVDYVFMAASFDVNAAVIRGVRHSNAEGDIDAQSQRT